MCALHDQGGGGRGRVGGEKLCAIVHAKLFWIVIYCANLRPNPGSQSGSQSRRGIGRQAPQIMREYDLPAVVAIHPLTCPRKREMGSLSFDAMIQLKHLSATRASFRSMPSTEKRIREKCSSLLWHLLPFLYFFSFSHLSRSFPICHLL